MAEVIALKPKAEPHLTGLASCLKCKHEWQAVAPVGTVIVVCPACDSDGVMKGAVAYDGPRWHCECGCDLFRISEKACWCVNCGTTQVFG